MRADAARNRAKVLDVAYRTFAEEGLAVPIDEIARRAGVGAGTLYRHFPTKEALFRAIVVDRLRQLTDHADELTATREPGEALRGFLAVMVEASATDQGLVEAMAGVGFDVATADPDAEEAFMSVLAKLLDGAQRAGAVRSDIGPRDLKVLMVGAQAMQTYAKDEARTDRVVGVLWDGITRTD